MVADIGLSGHTQSASSAVCTKDNDSYWVGEFKIAATHFWVGENASYLSMYLLTTSVHATYMSETLIQGAFDIPRKPIAWSISKVDE